MMNHTVHRRIGTAFLLFMFASGVADGSSLARLFAPKAELWQRWSEHDPAAESSIDHRAWSSFLQRNVIPSDDGINIVPYASIPDDDRQQLESYVQRLAGLPISQYSRAEQLPYWINLYNALTVKVVLDHYPVDSIRNIDISPGLFASGPWGKVLVHVEGEGLTLNDIEHRILRPIWRDPRIHYAVNCASIGCPNLQREAFTAGTSEQLMQQAARDYVNHPRGVTETTEGLILSSIYNWFADDFDADGGVIAHLRRYASPPLAA